METKLTKREMFEKIMTMTEDAEVIEFCEKEIAAIAKKNEKAKEYAAKRKDKADELKDAVLSVLTADYQTVADIVAALADVAADVTASKVISRLTGLVNDGAVEKADVTIPGGEGFKSRKVKAYRVND